MATNVLRTNGDSDGEPLSCPICSGPLQPVDGEYICEANQRTFTAEEIRQNRKWRGFPPKKKVSLFVEFGAKEIAEKYFLQPEQIGEAEELASEEEQASDSVLENVAPQKRALLSLALSIRDEAAICEFIDNSRDAGMRRQPGQPVNVSIRFDRILATLEIADDAGGMDITDLRRCLTLGSKPLDSDELIGRYGIGAKEAIYHFGREVTIKTRTAEAVRGMRSVVPADWLDSPDWNVAVDFLDTIPAATTVIKVGQLTRVPLPEDIARMRRHLWGTYERCLRDGSLVLELNEEPIKHLADFTVLYPPFLSPREYLIKCGRVSVQVRIMLIEGASDMSGLCMYAQGRRFVHLPWADARVMMVLGKVRQHSLTSHIRVEVAFTGPIADIPISSNKHDIQNNGVLEMLKPTLQKLVEPYFKSVNPLSQGGMGLVSAYQKNGGGKQEGYDSFDLGRVVGAIPSECKADLDAFTEWVYEQLRPTKATAAPRTEGGGQENEPAGDSKISGADNLSRQAASDATADKAARSESLSIVTFRVANADNGLVEKWLIQGRQLGLDIQRL